MRVIAFCGPKGCGKDTAAKCLTKINRGERKKIFRQAPMAQGVKNICSDFFGWTPDSMNDMAFKETPIEWWPAGPVLEPRWAMMDIANWLRDKYGGEIHAERWARHCEASSHWGAHVVTDMRFPEEVNVFKRYDFFPIYVEREEAEEALHEKQKAGDGMALNASESHYAVLRDLCERQGIVIPNNGEIYNLHNEVLAAVTNKFGHWKYWSGMQPLEAHFTFTDSEEL